MMSGAVAAMIGFAATSAMGQDDFGTSPFGNNGLGAPGANEPAPATPSEGADPESAEETEEEPAVRPNAPRGRADSIDAFQVRLAETEYMAGRLQVLDPYSGELRGVRRTDLLVIQEGEVVRRAQTGVEGVAQIKNLPVGEYSVVAMGPDGVAAFGFEVLPKAEGVSIPSYRFDTLLVPLGDMSSVKQSLCRGAAPSVAPVPDPSMHSSTMALPPIPVSMNQGAGKQPGPITPAPFNENEDSFAVQNVSAPLKGQPIRVQSGGRGVGQLVILDGKSEVPLGLANAQLSFIRGGQVLGTVQTDDKGYCGVAGLEDGVYSMVGIGENGYIALGVRVQSLSQEPTPAPEATARAEAGQPVQFVSMTQYVGPPVGWRVAGADIDSLGYASGFACGGCGMVECCGDCGVGFAGGGCGPIAGGGCFGGGGFGGGAFGGGGFGGGGLFGALLGAGLGAAIGAAIADDDDKSHPPVIIPDPRPVPPVSNNQPPAP